MKTLLKKMALFLMLSVSFVTFAQQNLEGGKIIKDDNGNDVVIINGNEAWLLADLWDNWFINVGIGAHSFVGNELVNSARWNGIQPEIDFGIGKWLSPSLGVSLNFDGFYAIGQSNIAVPYIDPAENPNNEYKDFRFYYLHCDGNLIVDLINLFAGYSRGKNCKDHPQLMLGMGFAWQTGNHANQSMKKPNNFEFTFTGGINNDVIINRKIILTQSIKCMVTRGSFDYSPGTNEKSRFDIMPALVLGVKFNFAKKATHGFIEDIADTDNIE